MRRIFLPCIIVLSYCFLLSSAALGDDASKTEQEKTVENTYTLVDLFDGKTLKGWKLSQFGGGGEALAKNNELTIRFGEVLSGVTYQKAFPKKNYELSLEAKRLDGADFFCGVTFPIGDEFCSLILGGWGGSVVGISSLNGSDASENETTSYEAFKDKTWYKVRVRVTDDKLEAWVDKKQCVNVKRKGIKFTVRPEVENSKPFGIATFQTTAAFRNIQVRKLKPKEISSGKRLKKRPNLLFILPDQWRGQALGFLGQEKVLTPNLDKLASESLVLTQAVSNYPVCSPYRAMLMTGQYSHKNGVLANCNTNGTKHGYELQQASRCWSDVLKEAGYRMGYIGKWHLEAPRYPYVKSGNNTEKFAWNEWTPPRRRHGFDYWHAYNTFDQHLRPEYWDTKTPRDSRVHAKMWGPIYETDKAIEFLKNKNGTFGDEKAPFALVVAMNPPHMPYRAVLKKYVDRYKGKTPDDLLGDRPDLLPKNTKWGKYTRSNIKHQYAMMTGVDEQVGRLMQTLKELNLEEDTLVIFTSDHGDCLGLNGEISKNNHYEPSICVPMIIRYPKKIQPKHDKLLVSTPDLFPTILDLLDLGDQIPKDVDGKSFANIAFGKPMERPTSQLYLFVPYGDPSYGRRGVRTAQYTLMLESKPGRPTRIVLHDNIADPYQMKNIAPNHPKLVEQLIEEELNPWLKKTGDPWLKRAEAKVE